MIAIDGIVITDKMHERGLKLMSNLYDASIQAHFGGIGGCKHLDINNYHEDQDLIVKYLDEEIDGVQATFISMMRAK